jgi:hypothetical protein
MVAYYPRVADRPSPNERNDSAKADLEASPVSLVL